MCVLLQFFCTNKLHKTKPPTQKNITSHVCFSQWRQDGLHTLIHNNVCHRQFIRHKVDFVRQMWVEAIQNHLFTLMERWTCILYPTLGRSFTVLTQVVKFLTHTLESSSQLFIRDKIVECDLFCLSVGVAVVVLLSVE